MRDELDHYIKSELLNTDVLLDNNANTHTRLAVVNAVRAAANKTIDFLAQLENYQKAIWEKKKFITATNYVVTLATITDQKQLDEIAKNNVQWKEWLQLGFITKAKAMLAKGTGKNKNKRLKFMQENPTLTIDTANFTADFTAQWLETVPDLDDAIDGVLFHSENSQALNLLQAKYQKKIKCVYIDPPYNTSASEILYKNGYKQSSWLALIENRISLGKKLTSKQGGFVIAIDDTQMVELCGILDSIFTGYDRNMVVINHHPEGSGLGDANISRTHEYSIFMTPSNYKLLRGEKKEDKIEKISFMRGGATISNLRRGRKDSFYAFLIDPCTASIVGVEPPPELSNNNYPRENTSDGHIRVYPISKDRTERVWRRSYKTIRESLKINEVICKKSKDKFTIFKVQNNAGKRRTVISNWTDSKFNAGTHGSTLLKNILGTGDLFSYPKSIYTVRDCIDACVNDDHTGALILDYFAGSGTTAHAVISLNREDGGKRKFILVEMGEYFDTVLLTRIKKVIFAPKWNDGVPCRQANKEESKRSPRIIKYHLLETYDDALENIEFDDSIGDQLALLIDYVPRYILQEESRTSASLAGNSDAFKQPFSYMLKKAIDSETAVNADLPETFAYLIGLKEKTRKTVRNGKRLYLIQTGIAERSQTTVIWRDTGGWTTADYEKERKFIAKQRLTEGAQRIYINDDSLIPQAESLNPVFATKMFDRNGS